MALVLDLLLIAVLVALNAAFVTAEYALLSVRWSRLEQLIREGDSRARLAKALLADVGMLFSGIQLGITVASVLMGWLGEGIIAGLIEQALSGHTYHLASVAIAHSIAVTLAFVLVTTLLAVLGELVPKNLAYERAEQAALLVSPLMFVFLKLAKAPVRVLDWLAGLVLGPLGHRATRGRGVPHTADEVKLIVSAIRQRGLLGEEQEEMIHSVFDLDRVRVREIMVPWPRVTCLPLSRDLGTLLDQVVKDQHSRIPIYEGTPDHIVGILYTKDLLGMLGDRQRRGVALDASFPLRSMLHQPTIVPESMPLNQMLDEARRRQTQMALVVDEFGTFTGLVTIEDVLEQIVGEIQDEYDREEKAIQKVSDNVLLVDASLSLREMADDYGIALPRGPGYETLAGFVLSQLGTIPQGGETFIFEGRRYTVTVMDGRRVAKVRVERLPVVTPITREGSKGSPA